MEPQVCVSCLRQPVQLSYYVRSNDVPEVCKVFKILLKYFNTNMQKNCVSEFRVDVLNEQNTLPTICGPCFSIGQKLIMFNNDLQKIEGKIKNLLDDYSCKLLQCSIENEIELETLFQENICFSSIDKIFSKSETGNTEELVEVKEEFGVDIEWDQTEDVSLNGDENFAFSFNDAHIPSQSPVENGDTDISKYEHNCAIPLKKLSISLERLDFRSVRMIVNNGSTPAGRKRPKKIVVKTELKKEVDNFTGWATSSKISKHRHRKKVLLSKVKAETPKVERESDNENDMLENGNDEDCTDDYEPPEPVKTVPSRKKKKKRRQYVHCEICSLSFPNTDMYSVHMKSPVNCELCDKLYFSHSTYTHHVKTCHSAKSFKCTECKENLESQYDLEMHQMTHIGEIPYECRECHEKFSNAKTYMSHQRKSKCPIFPGTVPPSLPCNVCDQTFKANFLLYAHQSAEHDKPLKGFQCNICSKTMRNSEELYIHYISHTREYAFTCDVCGKPNRSCLNFINHRRTHIGTSVACKLCDKMFRHKAALSRHIELVHNSNELMMCHVCSMGFKVKQDFQRHVATHFKTIICDHCGKAFNRNIDLKTHLRIHTGDMFPCDECGKKFVSLYLRNQHMKSTHMNIPKQIDRVVKPRAKRITPKNYDGDPMLLLQ